MTTETLFAVVLLGKLLGDEGETFGCDLFIMPSIVFSRVMHYLNFVVKFYFFSSSYQKERGFSIQLFSNSIALAKKMRKRLKKKKLLDHVRDKYREGRYYSVYIPRAAGQRFYFWNGCCIVYLSKFSDPFWSKPFIIFIYKFILDYIIVIHLCFCLCDH